MSAVVHVNSPGDLPCCALTGARHRQPRAWVHNQAEDQKASQMQRQVTCCVGGSQKAAPRSPEGAWRSRRRHPTPVRQASPEFDFHHEVI